MSLQDKINSNIVEPSVKNLVYSFLVGVLPTSLIFWINTLRPVMFELKQMTGSEIAKNQELSKKLIEDNKWMWVIGSLLFVVVYILISMLVGYIILSVVKVMKNIFKPKKEVV